MKTRMFRGVAVAAVATLISWCANAQSSSDTTSTQATQASEAAPVKLSYGVPDVLKLARAKVGEEVILAYIKNSGTIYDLNAEQIVYLRSQGVSDRMLTAMLGQREKLEALAAQTVPKATQTAPAAATATYSQPATAYVESTPAASASSVYVIPYSGYSPDYSYPYYYYYSYWPYYPSFYWGPTFSFRIGGHGGFGFHGGGFGSRGGGGGFHGGGGPRGGGRH